MRSVDYVVEFDSWVPWEQGPSEQLRLMKGFQFGHWGSEMGFLQIC